MAGSTSALNQRADFDAFLMASLGEDSNDNGMQLSVLSALARLGIDPWEEAVCLTHLPSETATQKLSSLIAALPAGRPPRLDPQSIAARLIPLLPRSAGSDISPHAPPYSLIKVIRSRRTKYVLIYVICMTAILLARVLAANHLTARQSDKPYASRISAALSQAPPRTSAQ